MLLSKASKTWSYGVLMSLFLSHRIYLRKDFFWACTSTSVSSKMRINSKDNIFETINADWTFLENKGYLSWTLRNLLEGTELFLNVRVLLWLKHVFLNQVLYNNRSCFFHFRSLLTSRCNFMFFSNCNFKFLCTLDNTQQCFSVCCLVTHR